MENFNKGFAEILDIDPTRLTPGLKLEEVGWDSLAQVSAIVLIDECYGKQVDPKTLGKCQTFGELQALIQQISH